MSHDVLIIGGGVIGCAIARELSRYRLDVMLLEKETDVAEGTSKANSGVVHAGFNVKPGSLKARFNMEGLAHFPSICAELGVPYRLTKKLVVAKDRSELPYLEKLLGQGRKNGCRGLSIIAGDAIRAIEPDVQGEFALFSELTAVISPAEFTIALAEVALRNGVEFRLSSPVTGIERRGGRYGVRVADGSVHEADIVVNAAGLYSDAILSMIEEHDRRIHPCRGEYFVLDRVEPDFLKTAVYPVPPADGRGLGIHLTPTTEGNIIIGPSAEYIDGRDDLATTRQVMETLKGEALELLPKLRDVAFIRAYAGIRPKLFVAGGRLHVRGLYNRRIRKKPRFHIAHRHRVAGAHVGLGRSRFMSPANSSNRKNAWSRATGPSWAGMRRAGSRRWGTKNSRAPASSIRTSAKSSAGAIMSRRPRFWRLSTIPWGHGP